jgi:hypothetical protein
VRICSRGVDKEMLVRNCSQRRACDEMLAGGACEEMFTKGCLR